MALFLLYDCDCGEKYNVYLPYNMLIRELQRRKGSEDLSSLLATAQKIDHSEQTQHELHIFKNITKFRSPVFLRTGGKEVIQCRCGRVIDLIKIISGWSVQE